MHSLSSWQDGGRQRGWHATGQTYVVPITYAYDGESIYARSMEGLKLQLMRANHHVCFEVDRVDDLANSA